MISTVIDVSDSTEELRLAEKGISIIVEEIIGSLVPLEVKHGHMRVDGLSYAAEMKERLLVKAAKIIAKDIEMCRH